MIQGLRVNPIGKRLPSVSGKTLAGVIVHFPEDVAGTASILFVAYRRGTQDDTDKWVALLQAQTTDVEWYEVPTIASMVWRSLAGWIDSGMRSGVSKDKWSRVVTIYDDAPKLRDFLGDSRQDLTHVVVLDRKGTVVWFNSEGFSEQNGRVLLNLLNRIE